MDVALGLHARGGKRERPWHWQPPTGTASLLVGDGQLRGDLTRPGSPCAPLLLPISSRPLPPFISTRAAIPCAPPPVSPPSLFCFSAPLLSFSSRPRGTPPSVSATERAAAHMEGNGRGWPRALPSLLFRPPPLILPPVRAGGEQRRRTSAPSPPPPPPPPPSSPGWGECEFPRYIYVCVCFVPNQPTAKNHHF